MENEFVDNVALNDEEKEILDNAALNEDGKFKLVIFYDNDDLFDSMAYIVTKDDGKRRIKNNFAKKLLDSKLAIKILSEKIETKEEKLSRWIKNAIKNSEGQYLIYECDDYKNIENNSGWNPVYYIVNTNFTETRIGRAEAVELIKNGSAVKITKDELEKMRKFQTVEVEKIFEPYAKENFLSEVFISGRVRPVSEKLLRQKDWLIQLSAKKTKIKLSSCNSIKITLTKILLWVTSRPKIILKCGREFSITFARRRRKIPTRNFSL